MRSRVAVALLLLADCNGSAGIRDGGEDHASVDSGPIASPDQIFGGLVQWLDADDPSSVVAAPLNNVVEWKDRSGNTNHVLTVAVGSGVSIVSQVANGHAALRVGPQRGILKSKSAGPLLGGFQLVAVVAAYTNPPAQMGILYMETESAPISGVFILVNTNMRSTVFASVSPPPNGATTTTDGWNDGRFHAFGLRFISEMNVAVRVDGIEEMGTTIGAGSSGGPLRIGGDYGTSDGGSNVTLLSPFDGYIAEIIAAGTPGTSLQISQLNSYFQKKYGIPF